VQELDFHGHRCAQINLGPYELLVTLNAGPRVISLRRDGGPNIMKVYEEDLQNLAGSEFQLYGGHRLWLAPEVPGFTDEPDNFPVQTENGFSSFDKKHRIRKTISFALDQDEIVVSHHVRNEGDEACRVALWALTVLKAGAICVIPQSAYIPHGEALLPARPYVVWTYTRMDDSRVRWGSKTVTLKHDPDKGPFKYGTYIDSGVAAAWVDGFAFIKRFDADQKAEYADMGCNFETFTREDMLELETLGPLTDLHADGEAAHIERWRLTAASAPPDEDEACAAWLERLTSG
jgi:hypothetical protein